MAFNVRYKIHRVSMSINMAKRAEYAMRDSRLYTKGLNIVHTSNIIIIINSQSVETHNHVVINIQNTPPSSRFTQSIIFVEAGRRSGRMRYA